MKIASLVQTKADFERITYAFGASCEYVCVKRLEYGYRWCDAMLNTTRSMRYAYQYTECFFLFFYLSLLRLCDFQVLFMHFKRCECVGHETRWKTRCFFFQILIFTVFSAPKFSHFCSLQSASSIFFSFAFFSATRKKFFFHRK